MLSRPAATSGLRAMGLLRPSSTAQCLATSHRWFSQTAPRPAAHIITFTPSSNPELNQLLSTMRDQILLPYYLPADQRKHLSRARYQEKLSKDPITMEIDGEVHKFTYQDPRTMLPSARATVLSAMRLMETREDFENMARMLEGLHSVAERRWSKPWDLTRIARRAGHHGQIYSIIECARRVDRTGVKLDNAELIAEIMYWVQQKAWGGAGHPSATWGSQRDTKQALAWADMVVDLLQLPEHQTAATPKGQPSGLALKYDPKWTAAQLHLAAALADKFPKPDKPEEDAAQRKRVADLAATLIKAWPAGKGLRELHPPLNHPKGYKSFLEQDNGFLRQAAPILHGLDLAAKLVEPELASQLQTRRDALAKEIEDVLAKGPEKQLTGRAVYDALFGTQHAPSR